MKYLTLALFLFACPLIAGCDPRLTALTAAPPTAVAELDTTDDSVRLSQGIALAFECTAYAGGPCENAAASSADEAITKVFPAFVDLLAPGDTTQRAIASEPRAVFVLVGAAPGDTTVTITSGDGSVDVSVKVLPFGVP